MEKLLNDIQSIEKTRYEGTISYRKNPMGYLYDMDLVTKVGNGIFVFEGVLVEIMNKIESMICEIANLVGADHIYVPSNLSMDNAKRSEYLDSFRDQALALRSFQEKLSNKRSRIERVDKYHGISSPTVCHHYFSSLRNKVIRPNYTVTSISKCTRKEKGVLDDLSRLTNFTMREVIIFGEQEYVRDMRNRLLSMTIDLLKSNLDLSFKIVTASDPFFGKMADIKKKAQLAMESKYEAQVLLPYKNESSSVASFNFHGNVFYERFNIKPKNKKFAFSGCVAWGYERILYAIISQKGLNFSDEYYRKLLSGEKNIRKNKCDV